MIRVFLSDQRYNNNRGTINGFNKGQAAEPSAEFVVSLQRRSLLRLMPAFILEL